MRLFPVETRKRLITGFLLFVISCMVCFSFYNGQINEDNFNYGLEQIHAYDASIFSGNISVVDSEVSPRRFSNQCTAWLMSFFDGDWFEAATLIIRTNYLLYAAAIAFLVYSIVPKRRAIIVVLVAECIMAGSLPSLGFDINGAMDVFLGTGIPIAMIGITFAIRKVKNWDAAWLFATLAALMHIHEGIWGGFMIGVIWLATSLAEREILWKALRMLPIYITTLLIISIPSLLSDEVVDPTTFLQIYVFWRTPHHFLLSEWGGEKIVWASLFSLFPFLLGIVQAFPYRTRQEQRRKIFLFSAMIILWFGILGIEFFFTEIVASPLLITLYIPKCIKFIVFVAYIGYIAMACEAYAHQKYLQAFFILASLVTPRSWAVGALVLYLVCWLGKIDDRFVAPRSKLAKIFLEYGLIAFLLTLTVYFLHGTVPVAILCGILWMVELLDRCVQVRIQKVFGVIAAIGIVTTFCFSLKDKLYYLSEDSVALISGEESMRSIVGDDVYEMALDFQAKTDSNVQFLADPYSSTANAVQLISQRNCYCLQKNTPSSKGAVLEWYNRILRTKSIPEYTDEELAQFMRELGLEYVLVSGDQMSELQQSKLFVPISETETVGMYREVSS